MSMYTFLFGHDIILFSSAFPFWPLASISGFVLLIILLLFISLFYRRMRRQRAFKKEYAEAEFQAVIEAQRIKEREAAQQPMALWSQHEQKMQQFVVPGGLATSFTPVATASAPQAIPDLHCPQCNNVVLRSTNYCARCRISLAPLAGPGVAGGINEHPTIDMPLSMQTTDDEGNRWLDREKTMPYLVQPLHGSRPGFEVVTRSDPGIKRKHKPNEDSLFAARGVRRVNGSLQQIGLFVVADGMGGHANGQDASRLAIQTLINHVVPRLLQSNEVPLEELVQLLVAGVQSANQAVYTHNLDNHADMGTTVTATLLVDTIACVANVGDSRTYLYRVSEGLSKVTKDHSVVASLVDAGIIQPDDIYTHPKRNQIYRSLGEKPEVEVDPFIVQLQTGDTLLLCSDGLWDMVRDPKIEAVLRDTDAAHLGDGLIQAALGGGGEDNVSVIVVSVTTAMQRDIGGFQVLTIPETVHMPPLG